VDSSKSQQDGQTSPDGREWRTWTSADGQKAQEAAFVEARDGYVHVVTRAGAKGRLRLDQLSPTDRDYIDRMNNEAGDLFDACEPRSPSIASRPPETADLEYVGFWPRCGASLIDLAIFVCITWPLLIGFSGENYFDEDPNLTLLGMIFGRGPFDFVLSFVFPAVATISFWVWKQATPGKMAIGAKIVDATSGRCPTVGQFVVRYLMNYVSLFALGLGYLWVFFNPRKQGWHDLAAGTVVIRPKHRQKAQVSFGN